MLGCHTPESLNYTVYYIVSQQFGIRGCQEHYQIRIEDLKWVKDPDTDCTIYIEWIEVVTKTRKGGLQKAERALKQRMFATGGPHSLVLRPLSESDCRVQLCHVTRFMTNCNVQVGVVLFDKPLVMSDVAERKNGI